MKRYIIDWDFSNEHDDYQEKSKAATELCETELDGIRISQSTWMIEYDGSLIKLAKAFIGAVYKKDSRKFVRPSRGDSGKLQGDHFNIIQAVNSFHSDQQAVDAHFSELESIERMLAKLEK